MKFFLVRHHQRTLKNFIMKKLIFVSAILLGAMSVNAQKSVDRLFQKYSDREGFTCISISGNLLNIAARLENEDGKDRDIEARITEVRILTAKDDNDERINFHDEVLKGLDLSDYEEMMSVKESDQDMKMLVRTEGRKVKELLLLTGGEDNALIQVKGDMTLSDARKLCENAKKHHGVTILDVD